MPLSAAAIRVAKFGVKNFLKLSFFLLLPMISQYIFKSFNLNVTESLEIADQLRGFVQKLFSFTFALVPLSAAAIRVAKF